MYDGMVYIYALVDSITNQIRYIGKTVDPKRRLCRHISKATSRCTTHKDCWIKQLITLNLKPYMIILQCVDEVIWKEREIYWIAKCKKLGFKLTNSTLGGGGFMTGKDNPMFGRKHSPEAIEKIRVASSNISMENRRKKSEAMQLRIGEQNPVHKLKEREVLEIADLYQNKVYLLKEIGILYNIKRTTIDDIINKKTWKHLKLKITKLTYNVDYGRNLSELEAQCILDNKLLSRKQLSDKHNIGITTVRCIITRKTWKHLTPNIKQGI